MQRSELCGNCPRQLEPGYGQGIFRRLLYKHLVPEIPPEVPCRGARWVMRTAASIDSEGEVATVSAGQEYQCSRDPVNIGLDEEIGTVVQASGLVITVIGTQEARRRCLDEAKQNGHDQNAPFLPVITRLA